MKVWTNINLNGVIIPPDRTGDTGIAGISEVLPADFLKRLLRVDSGDNSAVT